MCYASHPDPKMYATTLDSEMCYVLDPNPKMSIIIVLDSIMCYCVLLCANYHYMPQTQLLDIRQRCQFDPMK